MHYLTTFVLILGFCFVLIIGLLSVLQELMGRDLQASTLMAENDSSPVAAAAQQPAELGLEPTPRFAARSRVPGPVRD